MILIANIGFSLFMVTLNQPAVTAPFRTSHIVWTPFALWMVAGELLAIALSVGSTVFYMSRRRDYL